MTASEILSDPLVWPIAAGAAAGAVSLICSRRALWACKILALAAAVAVGAAGVALWRMSPAPTFSWTWAKLSEDLSLNIDLAASPLGLLVMVGAAAFAILICVYSFAAMAKTNREGKFYTYLIWALTGSGIVGVADNLLVLLIGWEIVTLMLFLMVNLGKADAPAGAAKAYGILGFADACLLMAVALLVALEGGSANLSLSRGPISAGELGPVGYIIYTLILIAALAKAGAIPLHTWIPSAAEDAPTPVMAYLPAALDKLLGIYLLAVLSLRLFRPDGTMQVVMMIIGAVTILAAVLMAMCQHNLKRLLSFHAVSQVGYMVLGIGTGTTIGVIGGLFHMLNNTVYKSGLFLMSGTTGDAAGSDEIEDMGGFARLLPITFVTGLIAAAAISGVPPLNGFCSKWLVYQGVLELANKPLAVTLLVVAVFGSALTLASFVKVMYAAFLSPAPTKADYARRPIRESALRTIPMIVLAAACVVLGLWPQLAINGVFAPAIAEADTTGPGVSAAGAAVRTGTIGLWNPTQVTVLLILGIVGGVALVWIMARSRNVRVVRPFLGGEVPAETDDRFRLPGTHLYRTVEEMPHLGPLLKHGQAGALDLYRWSGRYGGRFVQLLRAQHSGLLGLYVAWCLIGLVVTVIYLVVSTGS